MPSNSINMIEGTTRLIEIECFDRKKPVPFDFEDYEIQTYLTLQDAAGEETGRYISTTAEGNLARFIIPDTETVGKRSGWFETRIFKGDETYSVIQGNIWIGESKKPDTDFHGGE